MCQPGRPASAPRARPGRLARLRRLPQHEVLRVLLVGRDLDAGAGDHLVERAMRQPAIVRHRRDVEQHMALGHVSMAARDQPLDHRLHRIDMLGGARLHRRRQAAERIDVRLEVLVGLFRHRLDRHATLGRARVDLVVDVGDVAHVSDVLGAVDVPQQPEQHVEHDDRAGIADMGEVIDRRPAHIHAHARGIERNEGPLLPGQRIVKLELHDPRHPSAPLAGRLDDLDRRKDGRSQRFALANNLPANAASLVKAVHGRHNAQNLWMPSSPAAQRF